MVALSSGVGDGRVFSWYDGRVPACLGSLLVSPCALFTTHSRFRTPFVCFRTDGRSTSEQVLYSAGRVLMFGIRDTAQLERSTVHCPAIDQT